MNLQTQNPAQIVDISLQRDHMSSTYTNTTEVSELKKQLQMARQEIDELKKLIAKQHKSRYTLPDSDEEETIIAQETAWLLPKHKTKKRKAVTSPEKNDFISDIPNKVEFNKNINSSAPKNKKPPPIVISNTKNYKEVDKMLQSKEFNFKANLMNNNQVKINVNTDQEYRDLTKIMNDNKYEWHTYENKQTRPIRVMVRNLHPSYTPEEIKADLIYQGYKIQEVVNKIKKIKQEGKETIINLPLFMMTFDNSENIKKIYEIRYICRMKVTIEAWRSNKLIPQCKKCQRFGHTQKFCQRIPQCVKCAGNHLTKECEKSKNTPAKCSNCGEAHPANYRGCLVAKELQKRRNNMTKTAQNAQQPRPFAARPTTNEHTYAQATQNNEKTTAKQMETVMQMLQNILTRLERLEVRNTGAVPRRTN